ncbi:MAG: Nramp family divalent metal transporter [Anaerolineae bacterium]|nr:Nramp family divalent metal transporter [Anaerolineae bacterium]
MSERTPWLALVSRRVRGAGRRPRRPGWLKYLAVLGPGIIAAAAGNDAGGITTYSTVGAQYGYQLLWAMVLITVSLIVVQEMVARLGAVTGKGLSDLIREQFGVRWTAFAMLALLVANAGTTTSEFAGVAAAMELFGISKYISVPIAAVMIWWLVARGSFGRVERLFLAMSLIAVTYIVSAFLARPDWGAVLSHTVVPTVRWDAGFLVMFVALVGTTITPYMQIYQQSSIVEKGITARDYGLARVDVITGVLFSDLVSYFIIVATGATLFFQGTRVETAADAAAALAPVAGPFASTLFAVGLLGASVLAAGVLPIATAFPICEAFGWEAGMSRDMADAPVFYGIFTSMILVSALVTLIPGLPLIQLQIVVQVINGLLLPIELVFITLLASNHELLGRFTNGRGFAILAWTTTLVVGVLALALVVITVVLPIFGIQLG